MSYLKSVSKHLESLSVSGYGEYLTFISDPVLGRGVYEVGLDGCILRFFRRGLTIDFKDEAVNVLYSDILSITSHITAAVFSKASESQDVSISVPLEIHLSGRVVVVEVQLLAYSRVLIVLNDLWSDSKV
ncbi:hypothetical protein [Pseudomonas sp. Pf153]|uniref:hypothetical protein n=1 Tax=Pseudomonas sp. Pf153 TaxID=1699309 RepID=UPI0012E230AD|nr:hypothetical protein [Pseudomonas sp. Pf153]